MKTYGTLLFLSSLLFLAGCQPESSPVTNTALPAVSFSQTPPPAQEEGIEMFNEGTPVDPQAQKMIQLAKESLVKKFKLNEDQVHVASIQAMDWPDAGIGCPQAGMVYAEVITPGYQILFEANGQSYSYHTDTVNKVLLCRIHPVDDIFLTP